MEGASGFHLETFGMKFEIFQIVQRSVTVTEIISSPTSFFKIPEKTNLATENCAKAVNIQFTKKDMQMPRLNKEKQKQNKP